MTNTKRLLRTSLLAFALAFGAFGQTPPSVVASQNIIQYSDDYTSLIYLDGSGQKVSVLFTDAAKFNDLVLIRDQQLQAIRDNQTAANNYNQAVKNAQMSVDAGREAPPLPTKPQMRVVSNDGKVSYVDFVPPLLSIVVTAPNAPSTGSIKSPGPASDTSAQSQAQLTVILNQLKAIIGALQAQGIM
jgi:hypothetical protein